MLPVIYSHEFIEKYQIIGLFQTYSVNYTQNATPHITAFPAKGYIFSPP